jgi:hypothetical protein
MNLALVGRKLSSLSLEPRVKVEMNGVTNPGEPCGRHNHFGGLVKRNTFSRFGTIAILIVSVLTAASAHPAQAQKNKSDRVTEYHGDEPTTTGDFVVASDHSCVSGEMCLWSFVNSSGVPSCSYWDGVASGLGYDNDLSNNMYEVIPSGCATWMYNTIDYVNNKSNYYFKFWEGINRGGAWLCAGPNKIVNFRNFGFHDRIKSVERVTISACS